jgi:hypothetical protein
LIRFPTPPHTTTPSSISGRPLVGRTAPSLSWEAPPLSRKLAVILRAVMWIRQSDIRIVYPQKNLGVLVFPLWRSRAIWMELHRQFSVSPLDVLGRGALAYPQYFIQTLRFHATEPRNRFCARRNLCCSHVETPPKSNICAPGNRSCRRSLEAHMTSARRIFGCENTREKYKRRSHYWYINFLLWKQSGYYFYKTDGRNNRLKKLWLNEGWMIEHKNHQ